MKQLKLNKIEIQHLADEISYSLSKGSVDEAFERMKFVLDSKTRFTDLDELGLYLGKRNLNAKRIFFQLLDRIIDYDAMGSYVVVSKALIPFLTESFDEVIANTKSYMLKGDAWHVCDNMSERSIGQALVDYFERTLPVLDDFLRSSEKWLKRSAGVAIHFFSKRVQNNSQKTRRLLKIIELHFEEDQKDAAKGIGWGLKTIGKHHPELLVSFLKKMLGKGKKPSGIIIRKSVTYLPNNQKQEIKNLFKEL